jgi:hypothetical protein
MQFKILRNIGSATVRELANSGITIDQWAEGQTVDLDETTAAEMLRRNLATEVIEGVPATAGDIHGEAPPPAEGDEAHKGKHKHK